MERMAPEQGGRPLIGVVPSHSGATHRLSGRYLEAVWTAGGLPAMLAYTTDERRIEAYAGTFDGFLFSGGADVDPRRYGEEATGEGLEIDAARDAFETALFGAVYPTGKPILGVCRGLQIINVCLGGTLYQHIEGHRQTEPHDACPCRCRVEPGGRLDQWTGLSTIRMNSFHHQAVREMAPALTADARSLDGYVEAAYAPDHPFLYAVQFHPEIYAFTDADDGHGRAVLTAFVEACRGQTSRRG